MEVRRRLPGNNIDRPGRGVFTKQRALWPPHDLYMVKVQNIGRGLPGPGQHHPVQHGGYGRLHPGEVAMVPMPRTKVARSLDEELARKLAEGINSKMPCRSCTLSRVACLAE